MLKGFQTVTSAENVINYVISAQSHGSNLTKFTTNSGEVLTSVLDRDRRKNVTDEELTFGKLIKLLE